VLATHRLPTALGAETFTANGAPWVPQEWLFGILVAVSTDRGLFLLLALAVSALPLTIFVSIYLRARGSAGAAAIGVTLLCCGIALLESFGIRAQVLGWAAFAAFMLFIERDDVWYYAAFPTAIVWANLHASVAIAPAVILARIVAAIAGGRRSLSKNRDVLMLFGVLLATLCTPLGVRLPALATALATSPIRRYIVEWQPSSLHDLSFVLGALPLAAAIVLGGSRTLWRDRLRSFPAALLFGAALFAFRNVPLFAIAAAPLAATALTERFPGLDRFGARLRELQTAGLASVCIAVALAGVILDRSQRLGPPRLPIAAVASLAAAGVPHRLFCEDFTWCSIALGDRGLRVFMDGRCDAYPLAVWRQYLAVIEVSDSWHDPLRADRVDSVIATRGRRLAHALGSDPRWRIAYSDAAYVLYRRE
jgi:hypothetical protein